MRGADCLLFESCGVVFGSKWDWINVILQLASQGLISLVSADHILYVVIMESAAATRQKADVCRSAGILSEECLIHLHAAVEVTLCSADSSSLKPRFFVLFFFPDWLCNRWEYKPSAWIRSWCSNCLGLIGSLRQLSQTGSGYGLTLGENRPHEPKRRLLESCFGSETLGAAACVTSDPLPVGTPVVSSKLTTSGCLFFTGGWLEFVLVCWGQYRSLPNVLLGSVHW